MGSVPRFCVRDADVTFSAAERAMANGGAVELELLAPAAFRAGVAYGGAWTAARDMTLLLVFDNSASLLRPREVAVVVTVAAPGAPPPPPGAMAAYRREWRELHDVRS